MAEPETRRSLVGVAARQRRSDDEAEQTRVASEDAEAEAAALIRQRDDLRARLLAAEAALAEERRRGARREAAVQDMRRGFEAALAKLSTEKGAETVTQEELRVALEELRVTVDALEESNTALVQMNLRLEREVAERTAELREALATSREQEARLRLIFEGATDTAILTLDDEGRVSAWNPGAERLLGFSESEVLGHRLGAMWTAEDLEERQPELEMCRALEEGRAEDERWHMRKDGSRFWASGIMVPLPAGPGGQHRGFLKIMRDRTEAWREQERRAVLLKELDHRVKNALAVVQSVAMQSLRYAPTPVAFQEALVARLAALARSHNLLTQGTWQSASLRDIVGQTLAAHADPGRDGRLRVQGPPIRLTPTAAITLNLAFHELATNAAKYGALSTPDGGVDVAWRIDKSVRAAPIIEVLWRERGGPPVQPPKARGFGTRLIERGLGREFGAEVHLNFEPAGVQCVIHLPFADRVVAMQHDAAPYAEPELRPVMP